MKTVEVVVKAKLVIQIDNDDANVDDVINELDYEFKVSEPEEDGCKVVDSEIMDAEAVHCFYNK